MTTPALPLLERQPWMRYTLWTVLMAIGFLFFAFASTPLRILNYGDSFVFQTMGETWLHGGLPYHDFFDHKGPILYIIQMVWLSLGIGKWGLFFLELLFGVWSCELMYRCGRVVGVSPFSSALGTLVGVLLFYIYLEFGNTVEEWSLPFQVLGLLITLKILSGKGTHYFSGALLMGLCFGLVAMMRINNNCLICGCVIGLSIYFTRKKEFIILSKCALVFCSGILIILLPFIIYFLSTGTLDEAFHANFQFNFNYRGNFLLDPKPNHYVRLAVYLLPAFILPIISVLYDRKNNTFFAITLIISSLILICVFISGEGFLHYYLLTVPFSVICIQMCSGLGKWRYSLTTSTIIIILLPVGY